MRAYWSDRNQAEKRSVLVGSEEDEKRLKDTYGSEADAMAAAFRAATRGARQGHLRDDPGAGQAPS